MNTGDPRTAVEAHAAACWAAHSRGVMGPTYAGPSLRGADLRGQDAHDILRGGMGVHI